MDIRDAIVDYLDGKIDLEGVRKIKQSWNPDLEEPNLNSPVIRMYMEEYGVNAKEALKIRRREIDELNRGMKEYYQTEYYEKKIDCLRQSMELKFDLWKKGLEKTKNPEEKQKLMYGLAENLNKEAGYLSDEITKNERFCNLVELGLGGIM